MICCKIISFNEIAVVSVKNMYRIDLGCTNKDKAIHVIKKVLI